MDYPGYAEALAAWVPPAAGAPFHKKDKGSRRVATLEAGFSPEDVSKYHTLANLYAPDDPDWDAAFAAPAWNHPNIAPWCRRALDAGWAVDRAKIAAQEAERAKEAERVKATHKRAEKRFNKLKPVRKFLKEKKMITVHEAAVPKQPDPLAVANPLSLEYGQRKRKARAPRAPQQSPEPDPAINEEAAGFNVQLVPLHKEKRLALGAAAADATEQKAEAVLAALPADVAAAVAKKFVNPKKSKKKEPAKKKQRVEEKKEEEKEGDDAAKQEKIKVYYKKKLKEINDKRQAAGQGPLNKLSRNTLLGASAVHYLDREGQERGFAGSALGGRWDRFYYQDFGRHPPAAEGEENSDTDDE